MSLLENVGLEGREIVLCTWSQKSSVFMLFWNHLLDAYLPER